MTKLILSFMMAVGLAASPAASAPAPADAPGATITLSALLDGGYEIKSVLPLSDADQKSLWPNDPVAPFSLIVLQKGASLAVCTYPTASLTSMAAKALTDPAMCHKR